MAVKTNQEIKRRKKAEKKAKVDKITNWFMINLAWGVFGFIVLRYLEGPLMNDWDDFMTGEIGPVKSFLGTLAICLGVLAVLLLALRVVLNYKEIKFFKTKSRVLNYGIFTAVVAAVVYYLSAYNRIRQFIVGIFPSLVNMDTSFWITGALTYAIGIYLVGAFIYTAVRVALIERKK